MKVIILFAFVVAVKGVLIHPHLYNTGVSSLFRNQNSLGQYNFGYNEDHASGGTFRRESSDGLGNVIGAYGLRDADGRVRVVKYVADAAGFRVNMKTNEPGVEPKDPASTAINKPALLIPPIRRLSSYVHTPALHESIPSYVLPNSHPDPVKYFSYHY